MKKSKLQFVSVLATLFVVALPLTAAAWPDPIVEVDPLIHDFGDVVVGETVTTMVTIGNVGGHPLTVSEIFYLDGSNSDYSLVNAPTVPFSIDPAGVVNVEVGFNPTALGYESANLIITCNDEFNCPVVVSFGGVGITEPPDQVTIADIIAFFDQSVLAGTLDGVGPNTCSRNAHKKVFRALLVSAGTLFEGGYDDWGCFVLSRTFVRSDGLPRPPDFIQGTAKAELNAMIFDVLGYLNCAFVDE